MKKSRKKNNLSLAQLASLSGISANKLSRLERGLCQPREKEARWINEILGENVLPLKYICKQSRRKVGGK